MELQLKNIGMIKEANVKIDGLTVIAGENDTGKSTVGKAVYTKITKKNILETLYNKESKVELIHQEDINDLKDCTIFMETPIVWSFIQSRKQIALVESQYDIKLSFPTLMKDLIFKLEVKYKNSGIDIFDTIVNIIDGYFKQDKKGDFYFYKDTQQIELENTAMGIKQFGILQVLSKNGYLNSNTLLILDEPEVHLHPKWQLEMAKIIVELVKNGVKIVVNSHSPYMIEALERYA
jgi:predicted ATPase